jgi:hypothetical protein
MNARYQSLRALGGAPFVPMMQPANLRHCYHAPRLRRLHLTALRRVLLQRQMSSVP